MAFFDLKSLPGTTWPAVPAVDASQLWAAYLTLDRTQWLSPAELQELQLRQLRTLLLHCFHEIPYYRRALSLVGFPKRPIVTLNDFRRLPLLTRELYQTNFSELQAGELPPGMSATSSVLTSGTNGVPLKVISTNRVTLWWSAFFLRDLEWSGLDPGGRLAAIRLVGTKPEDLPAALEGRTFPSWSHLLDSLVRTGPSYLMDIRQDPRRQLAWLHRIQPNYLLSMPTNLELLAGFLEQSGARIPSLRAIQAFGEPLSPSAREHIETAFGVPVKNLYSATEAGYLASPCPSGHGLHVHSENVLAEVLDADDRPCLPGETGRLVLTTLHNFVAPFLRYDILDDVTLAPAPCPCGRGLPLWTHVEGRRHPALYLPDGRRKSSMGITMGVRKLGVSRQFQIIQRQKDHVVLRVVPNDAWTSDHANHMRQIVQREFESPIRVDVEEHPFLVRPEGGKLKIVVVEIERDSSIE